jgi:hypothetical protein
MTPRVCAEHVAVGDPGTNGPSMIWVGNTFQFDIEALIPINRQSDVGVIAQLHPYLDDIDPRGIANRCSAAHPACKPFPRN